MGIRDVVGIYIQKVFLEESQQMECVSTPCVTFFLSPKEKSPPPPGRAVARQSNGADSVRGTLKKSDTWSGER